MLHKREPLVEVQKIVKNEKKDEVKNEEPQPPTISREEEIRREINANDLADELTNDQNQNGAEEDELCTKCKKNPSRNCRECGCQVIFKTHRRRFYVKSKNSVKSIAKINHKRYVPA